MLQSLLWCLMGIGLILIPCKATHKRSMIVPTIGAAVAIYSGAYLIFKAINHNKKIEAKLVIDKLIAATSNNFLFVHGFADTHKQVYSYTKSGAQLVNGRIFTYDFPDATYRFWKTNWVHTSLGQRNEILGLKSAYDQVIKTDYSKDIIHNGLVLMGLSRGATTILSFMGTYKPQHIKAAIVESPFDSTFSVVKHLLSSFYGDKVPLLPTLSHYAMGLVFWSHSAWGEKAISLLEGIDKNIPILFVCSKQDGVVPVHATVALYKLLRSKGYHKVHIFIADHGGHGLILQGADGLKYTQITHAFYKKYGLKHDELLAQQGALLLETTQP